MLKRLICAILAILLLSSVTYSQIPKATAGIFHYTNTSGRTFPTLLDGMTWRGGDTLFYRINGETLAELISRPGDGQTKIWDSANNIWRFGTPAGGGGASRWNELLSSNGNTGSSIGTYTFWITAGSTVGNAPSFWFDGTSNVSTGYVSLFTTSNVGSMNRPIGIFARGTSNGVYMDSVGNFKYAGSGTIDANLWKGATTFDKASQHAQTAYKDQGNVFTGANVFMSTTTTPLAVSTTAAAHGFTALATTAGYGAVRGSSNGYAYGVWGHSAYAEGGFFNSNFGNIAAFAYNSVVKARFGPQELFPETAGGYGLGTAAKPFRELHADSAFVGGWKVTPTIGGKAYFGANDTAYVAGLGTDTTYAVQATLAEDPGGPVTYYAVLNNSGELWIVSKTSGVEGRAIYYTLTKRTF